MPKFEFCLPTLGKAVPAGPEWFHEIKFAATAFASNTMANVSG
jgi:hypothetical protein